MWTDEMFFLDGCLERIGYKEPSINGLIVRFPHVEFNSMARLENYAFTPEPIVNKVSNTGNLRERATS